MAQGKRCAEQAPRGAQPVPSTTSPLGDLRPRQLRCPRRRRQGAGGSPAARPADPGDFIPRIPSALQLGSRWFPPPRVHRGQIAYNLLITQQMLGHFPARIIFPDCSNPGAGELLVYLPPLLPVPHQHRPVSSPPRRWPAGSDSQ